MDVKTALKVGDPVQLKHGGLEMTVTDVNGNDITCTWHTDNQEPKYNVYPSQALQLVHKGPLMPMKG